MDPSSHHATATLTHPDDEGERGEPSEPDQPAGGSWLAWLKLKKTALWQQYASACRITVSPFCGDPPAIDQSSAASAERTDPFTAGSWRLKPRSVKRFMHLLHHRFKAGPYCVHLHFASPHQMAQLNQQHRNIAGSTDVLSFPQLPTHPEALFNPIWGQTKARWQHGLHLGDILICLAKVMEYAAGGHYDHHRKDPLTAVASPKAAATTTTALEPYLLLTITHGYLHLLGYDHNEASHRAHMEAEERACLKQWYRQGWGQLIHHTTPVTTPMLRGHHGIS